MWTLIRRTTEPTWEQTGALSTNSDNNDDDDDDDDDDEEDEEDDDELLLLLPTEAISSSSAPAAAGSFRDSFSSKDDFSCTGLLKETGLSAEEFIPTLGRLLFVVSGVIALSSPSSTGRFVPP